MIPLFDHIVVEFSLSQKCFHVETIKQMLDNNQINMERRKQTDYIPIGIFKNRDLADEFIQQTKDRIKDYTLYTNTTGETLISD